jgi:hypothetical protein
MDNGIWVPGMASIPFPKPTKIIISKVFYW